MEPNRSERVSWADINRLTDELVGEPTLREQIRTYNWMAPFFAWEPIPEPDA